jgi:hypothetical protein
MMNKGRLSQFEQRIAQLVEGSFARLFAGRLHPHEVATRLARAMEDNARTARDGTLLAPNIYSVRLNPEDHTALLAAQPDLALSLSDGIIELAVRAGMHLAESPTINLAPDTTVTLYEIVVEATLSAGAYSPTEAMEPVSAPPPLPAPVSPRNPQLIVQGTEAITLTRPVINIGRRRDNHIVIDDPRVSRAHVQLRLRFERYVIYDLDSKGGTFVNGHRITECILKPGDVISLAGVKLVYMEDDSSSISRDTPIDTQFDLNQVRPAPDGDSTL